jgi:SAM-dependent methyltransferase
LTYFEIVADVHEMTGSGFKAFEGSSTAVPSLVASAQGVVLEVGPGVGSQLDRFDKSKIDHIYGVELNPAFVSPLLAEVQAAKLQGKYTVILGAVEDERLLAEYGLKAGSVDSIVCIGTLCSVSNPEQVMRWMYRLLKPGGVFIFWEHRRSHDLLTRLVQGTLKPHPNFLASLLRTNLLRILEPALAIFHGWLRFESIDWRYHS